MNALLTGQLVNLTAIDPEEIGKMFMQWQRNSEYERLIDSDASEMHSSKANKAWLEKEIEGAEGKQFWFAIRAAQDQRLLGEVDLFVNQWNMRDAFVGIGLGERDFWGKGYGTEAMQLILRYAFTELNLHRVSLTVFEYNSRAIRSYEKAGFQHEGRMRGALLREGRRWDTLFMGILRADWFSKQSSH